MKKELMELQAKDFPDTISGSDHGDIEMQCQMLQLLMNKKITTFNFPMDLKSDNQATATELWQSLLAEMPPDLHTIIVRNRPKDYAIKPWDARPFFDRLLLMLVPNLEVLLIDKFVCDDSDLSKIADHLPKLR